MEALDVVIPAGGDLPPDLRAVADVAHKTLLAYGGKTVLARTLDALNRTEGVKRTILVGTPGVLAHPDAAPFDTKIPAVGSGPENIVAGIRAADGAERVLVVTADLPLLTPEIVARFVREAVAKDADFAVPLVRRREWEARFPDSSATFIPLADDEWTAGGLFLVRRAAFERALPHIERLFAARKSKGKMVSLLGPVFVARFLAKRVTMPDVLRKIESLLGCTGAPLLGIGPETAYDIDDAEDHRYLAALLNKEVAA